MPNAIIVEDDPLSAEILNDILTDKFPTFKIVGSCSTAHEAHQLIHEVRPDLVFLDVELPDKSGIELLNDLENYLFEVIFTTSNKNYAVDAFKKSAVDFLLKPLDEINLRKALNKFESKWRNHHTESLLKSVMTGISNGTCFNKRIGIPTSNGFEYIEVTKILRLQANVNYTYIYLQCGRKICVSKTLKEYENVLKPYGFCRVHQSHVVNLRFVKSYNKGGGGVITLDESTEVDVSKGYKEVFLTAMNGF